MYNDKLMVIAAFVGFLCGVMMFAAVMAIISYSNEDHTPPRAETFAERCFHADGFREFMPDGIQVVCRDNVSKQIIHINMNTTETYERE